MLLLYSYRLRELGQLQEQNWHENSCIFVLENELPEYFLKWSAYIVLYIKHN